MKKTVYILGLIIHIMLAIVVYPKFSHIGVITIHLTSIITYTIIGLIPLYSMEKDYIFGQTIVFLFSFVIGGIVSFVLSMNPGSKGLGIVESAYGYMFLPLGLIFAVLIFWAITKIFGWFLN